MSELESSDMDVVANDVLVPFIAAVAASGLMGLVLGFIAGAFLL